MDELPTTATGAECFFHGEQKQAAISWLLAFEASGCDQRFSSAVGSFPDPQQSVTVEMKTPTGQPLLDQEVKPFGRENKTETSPLTL